ncbi:putative glycerophosphoryl diester phosphodiesterase, partial [Operophtera brumata]
MYGVRCIGWSVNRPLEKLYWCGVLKAPYLANKLRGEPDMYGVRCIGWSMNRPLEKLYWRGVLKAPYLANKLRGEPD